jgi:hypothetical protein
MFSLVGSTQRVAGETGRDDMITINHIDASDAVPTADGTTVIEHGALKTRGGWFPVIRAMSGKHWYEMSYQALDLESALIVAKRHAEDDATRYCGDWDVYIRAMGEVSE